ncbi:MAG: hypothetical protein GX241_02425 [Ruminococcaceae bacterium]|nr:hypothetical protein [Oscillospiraceae bacterium]
MADDFNLSIDDILASLTEEKVDTPKKEWSMSEIDELLGIGETSEPMEKKTPIESAKVEEIKSLEVGREERVDIDEEKQEEQEEITQKTLVFDAAVFAKSEEKEEPVEKKAVPKTVKLVREEKKEDLESELVEETEKQTQAYMHLADDIDEDDEPELTLEDDKEEVQRIKEAKIEEKEEIEEVEGINLEKKALAGKTVGIYPVRNENIDHQIITEKVEKSADASSDIASNKYRERFFNAPQQKIARTADYEAMNLGVDKSPIERDGRIIKKNRQFTNTADLEPIPTIVSADAELSSIDKAIVANSDNMLLHEEEDEIVGQIKLVGFGEEEEIERINEQHAEEKLKEKRDKKIANFKLDTEFVDIDNVEHELPDDEDEIFTISKADALMSDFLDDEYETAEDKDRIHTSLKTIRKATFICMIVQAIITVIALVVTGLINKSSGNLEIIGGSAVACAIINIILLLAASLCGVSTIIRGFNGLLQIRQKKANAATGTLVVVVACLLQNFAIMIFVKDSYSPVAIYTVAGCLALTLASLGRFIAITKTLSNFEFITNGTQLYSSEKISGEEDAFEIGRGLLMGDPEICYNAKIERPSYFIENSFEDDPADKFASYIIIYVVGIALFMAMIFGIVKRDVVFAMGVFAAVCSIGIPAFTIIVSNIALLLVNKIFNKNGAAIVGHRAVLDSMDINAYVLDSTDIFKKGSCNIKGIKTFQDMRIDEAILHAAALVIESGGPLADVFDGVILGKKDLLPPVESLAYEERLGLSAWIHGRRVFLGSRELLINHNVQAPNKEFEEKYTRDNRKVIYLAIAGKISAMFVVKYMPDPMLRRYLQNIDRAGVSLLVRSCDCNITEELICSGFGLPLSAVKILSPVSGEIFQKYREEEIETAPAGIIHNGTIEASLKAIYEARELNADIPMNNIIATIYSGIAILVFLLISILTGTDGFGITGGQIVLFQLLFGVIATSIPLLKRKFDK